MENDQLQFLKSIQPLDDDKVQAESQNGTVEEAPASTLEDLFPDDDGPQNGDLPLLSCCRAVVMSFPLESSDELTLMQVQKVRARTYRQLAMRYRPG